MKIYSDKINTYETEIIRLSKQLKLSSFLRITIFLTACILLFYFFSKDWFIPLFLLFPIAIVAFGFALKLHNKLDYQKKQAIFLKRINEQEIAREKCELEGFDTGDRFLDTENAYTSDLDIFGEHSIFQLINRTTTESGMILLSKYLSKPADRKEIVKRQDAIKELSQKLEWRQEFQAVGMHFQNKKSDYFNLLAWIQEPINLLEQRGKYIAAAIFLPLLILIAAYFFYANLASIEMLIYLAFIIIILIINAIILNKIKDQAEAISKTSTQNLATVKGYKILIEKIENESFKSEKLQDLKSILKHDKYSVLREIEKLSRILEFSQQRPLKKSPLGGNPIYPLLNIFFLLDIHFIIDAEKWKSRNKKHLESWAESISEFEVLNSFAGFSFSNPKNTYPEIIEKNNTVHFKDLGHPLIAFKKRVCNDFHLEGAGEVVIITGSNMAGKSTFLRAVGINIV